MSSRHKTYKFIGVDGEGITFAGNRHEYVMLCASTGDYVENPEGLSTADCFAFLLNLKRKYPHHTLVGFGFNYDVNMMLRDLPRGQLTHFWRDRKATLILDDAMYDVTWIPTKFITVRQDITVQVSDVFGFFQTSFLTALKKWEIPDIDGAIERIESGKADRGNFDVSDMEEMRRYCITECEMLVELTEKLQESLVEAGLYVKNWIGAGAVGSALITQNGVLNYHCHDSAYPEKIQEAIMYAYFGGRFEMYRQGYFDQCYNYDIVSAYPYQCLDLPNLKGGVWDSVRKFDPSKPYALWLCSWEIPSKRIVMPFPYRYKGNVYYPNEGKGWYWTREVVAALAMHPEVRILGGYVFHPATDTKPFAFVNEVFEKRKVAKREGLGSEKAYKLGLNSLYGKLAQGKGYKGQVPRQRSFVWAGLICSNTRAILLEKMLDNQDKIIAVATDGLFFSSDPGFSTGEALGDLELNVCDDFYQLSNGIYYSPNAKIRTRGHSPKELDWDKIVLEWETQKVGGIYRYRARRFIGLGQALMRKDFGLWRQWIEDDRDLHLHQFFRKWLDEDGMEEQFLDVDEDTSADVVTWYPGNLNGLQLGQQYTPKTDILTVRKGSDSDAESVLQFQEMLDQPTLFIEN